MPKLYLLGGENVFRRNAREVNERAFQDAGNPLSVLVFPWARASFDRRYHRRKRLADYFKCLGADTVNFAEYSDSIETISRKMANSNLVYLTGGVTSVLVERLKNMGLDRLLSSYNGVIVGRSAGALALCRKCVITCRSNSKTKVVDGLGLVDFTLKVHYQSGEKDGELEHLSKEGRIFAVPEGSALVYEDGVLSFIGHVFLFENGERQTLSETSSQGLE